VGVIALKCALAVAAGGLAVWLPGEARIVGLEARSYRRVLWALAATSRCALFFLLYVVLGQGVPSDVSGYYVPEAELAWQGQVVYRDFPSSYGPGFPYLVGLLLYVSGSAKSLVALAIALELGALWAWGRLSRELAFGESSVRRGELLYVASAVPLLTIAVAGQNQSWLAFGVGTSLLLALRGSPLLAALPALGGAVFVKALALPFWLPAGVLLARGGRRQAVLFGLSLGIGVASCAGLLWHLGADPALPLRREVGLSSPGNLPFLAGLLLGPLGLELPRWLAWLGFAGVAGWLVSRTLRREPDARRAVHDAMAVVWLSFLVLSPKAFPGYFVIAALPIALFAATTVTSRAVYAVWQAVLAVLPSLWFRLSSPTGDVRSVGTVGMALFIVLHLAAVVCGFWLIRHALAQPPTPTFPASDGLS
jgi:hypothetical protein